MTETKPTKQLRRGRIFPEIQWTEEQKEQRSREREAFYQRCKPIFEKLKPELMQTHYNWYVTIEPDSGEYFINKEDIKGALLCAREISESRVVYFPYQRNRCVRNNMIHGNEWC